MADFEPIEESDQITADSVALRAQAVADRINDLEQDDPAPECFRDVHLPSMVVSKGAEVIDTGTLHIYDSNSDVYPGWDTQVGWTIINTNGTLGTGDPLTAVLDNSVDMADATIQGIDVYANVNLRYIWEDATGAIGPDFYACFAIQVHTDDGTWHHIKRTERYKDSEYHTDVATGFDVQDEIWLDVAIRTRITRADIASGNVDYISMVVSCFNARPTFALELVKVTLGEGNITAFCLQAGEIT